MFRAAALAALALATLAALPAAASELGAFYELGPRPQAARWSAGGVLLVSPEYDGSDKRRVLAVPAVAVQLPNGFFFDPVNGLGMNFSRAPELQYGVRVTVETGRDGGEPAGFPRIGARLNPGAFANWRVAEQAELRAAIRFAMAGAGGTTLHLGGAWNLWRSGGKAVSANLALRWSDADYNQAYFGVTPAQAASSGLRGFTPGSGFNAAQLGLSGRWQIDTRWTAFGSIGVQRLMGDAADSPLVQERTSPRLALGVAYAFQ